MHRRQSRVQRQSVEPNPVGGEERVGRNIKCLYAALERLKRGRDILRTPDVARDDLKAEWARDCLNLGQVLHGGGVTAINHYRQPAQTGDNFTQEFETLASKIGYLGRQASDVAARSRQTSDEVVADRIRHRCEYDRNDRRRRLRCDDVYGSVRNNYIDLKSNKFGDDFG